MTIRHMTLLALLMACGVLVVGQIYVTIPLVGDITDRFGAAPANAALAGSFFGFAYAVGCLLFGPLSDRYGRQRVLVLGLIALGLTTALTGLASSFALLLAARALQGLAAASFPPASIALIEETLPAEQRALGVSLISFAVLSSAPIAQFFAAQSGLGLSTIMLDLAPLYGLGALGLFLATRRHKTPPPNVSAVPGGHLGALLRDTGIVAAWGASATVLFAFISFHSGAQALSAKLGVDLQTLRLIGLPPLLLTLAAAPVTRRFGPRLTARIGLVVAACGLTLAMSGVPALLMAASAVVAAGIAFAVPGLIATIASRATASNRGLALAIYVFILFIGASLAPPIAQRLALLGTVPLWLLPVVLLLAAATALSLVGRPKPEPAH